MKLHIFGIIGLLTLSGCATQPDSQLPAHTANGDIALDELYIRGVFNWWEARENHRLNEKSRQGTVDVELIADGQPNDFKFSNQYWSPSQTCGGSYAGQIVSTRSTFYLTCGSEAQNLQFTPAEDGIYRFIVSDVGKGELRLSVVQIK
ncbi:hypothetical protein [Alteromonas sp. ASW11-130]|uniref:hypothetical protein n=1 Tax=Alteromonas sp. ASW11-130 TaxID=3015775 RepID=UPI002242390D|nr:hypothetical protein [Alteromonas sp. ASW11-130]MCW8093443.1 hypothetical protein [Alteromonas sp. ASW11-130]